MPKSKVTNAEFVAALSSEDERLLGALADRLIGSATAFLTGLGATPDEAEEIFWIGLTALWWQGRNGYPSESNLYAYFLQICKYQWYNDLRRKKRRGNTVTLDELGLLNDIDPSMQEILEKVEFNEYLYQCVDQLGEPCRTLLRLWAEGLSFDEIAPKMGYKTPDSARQQKHKCLERLRKLMDEGD